MKTSVLLLIFSAYSLGLVILPAFGLTSTNLLTVNPGFESVDFKTYQHGPYQFEGWMGENYLYSGHFISSGDATEGKKFFHMDWGGTITTDSSHRPAVIPGMLYEMRYDLRTTIGKFPDEYLGTISYLDFFDASGKRIKSYWGPDWAPQVQDRGAAPWASVVVRGLAPLDAASAAPRIVAPGGVFHDGQHNFTENRNVDLDNFQLYAVPEVQDQLAWRRVLHQLELGHAIKLSINYTATAPRRLHLQLLSKDHKIAAEMDQQVPSGQGLKNIEFPVPLSLPDCDYTWSAVLESEDGVKAVMRPLTEDHVFIDSHITLPSAKSADIPAGDPNIIRLGRWDETDPNHPRMNWYGTEIRARFNGTSATLLASAGDNGYGGPAPASLDVIIDGDESHIKEFQVDKFDGAYSLTSNLPEGPHTLVIFKAGESTESLRFDGLRLDNNHGLMRPEPAPTRKLEIYGDSVTSGGSASPSYLGYAPMLGRELNADIHIISKGGTGVAASFGHMLTLPDYWNLLAFPNVFDATKALHWDFSKWKPDGIIIAIGHNDQFNGGGGETFAQKYGQFVEKVRTTYPDVPIFCTNTVISADKGHYERAILPLVKANPKTYFAFQLSPWVDQATQHPPNPAHAAMVQGDIDRFSMADWIAEKLKWDLPPPPDSAAASR